jgi:phosphoglycolate phosphatase-like HAD superfamily hydrolase
MSWSPVTSSVTGPAPVLDFDGTLARLVIPWASLRAELGVGRIDELWDRPSAASWAAVERAEVLAAKSAEPVEAVVARCSSADAIAVLTSNSERAVRCFLARFTALEQKVRCVVGRETLAGPKSAFEVFARGFATCVDETADARGDGPVVYVGDMDYEIDFARALGAHAIPVRDIERAR